MVCHSLLVSNCNCPALSELTHFVHKVNGCFIFKVDRSIPSLPLDSRVGKVTEIPRLWERPQDLGCGWEEEVSTRPPEESLAREGVVGRNAVLTLLQTGSGFAHEKNPPGSQMS